MVMSESDYLSYNSQIAWLLFYVGSSTKTSKSGVHMRSFTLHSYYVMRTALADQFLLPLSVMEILTRSANAKSPMLLNKSKKHILKPAYFCLVYLISGSLIHVVLILLSY